MDFLSVFIVLAVAAVVIFGTNIIFIKVFVGDADNSFENAEFNPRKSLNPALNRKMSYYWRLSERPMRWLIFYQNFALPLVAVFSMYNAISTAAAPSFVPGASFFILLAYATVSLINAIIFRGIDKYAFYFNFVPSVILLFSIVFPFKEFYGFSVFEFVLMLPVLGGNAYYFIRRRGLFLTTLRQMKQEVEALDAYRSA